MPSAAGCIALGRTKIELARDIMRIDRQRKQAEAERDRYRDVLQKIASRRPSRDGAEAAFYRSRQDAKDALDNSVTSKPERGSA